MVNTKRARKWVAQALREKAPLTVADITLVVKHGTTSKRQATRMRRNTPTRNEVGNIVAKFPEFCKVGSIKVPGRWEGSYTVALWDIKD